MYGNLSMEAKSDECFAEKARLWIWILAMVIFLIVVLSITNFFSKKRTSISKAWDIQHNLAQSAHPAANNHLTKVRWVGFQPGTQVGWQLCPYCDGTLDPQGRCNVPDCPLYNPGWGSGTRQAVMQRNTMPVGMYVCPQCGLCSKGPINMCPGCGFSFNVKPAAVPNVIQHPGLVKEVAMEVAPIKDFPGVLAKAVYPGGWAQKAGMKNGDVIVKFNGRRIKSVKDFRKAVSLAVPELRVRIQFIRNGQRIKSIIMVGEGELEGVTPIGMTVPYQSRRGAYPCPIR